MTASWAKDEVGGRIWATSVWTIGSLMLLSGLGNRPNLSIPAACRRPGRDEGRLSLLRQ